MRNLLMLDDEAMKRRGQEDYSEYASKTNDLDPNLGIFKQAQTRATTVVSGSRVRLQPQVLVRMLTG
jgi:hypothetical protein